MSTFTAAGTDTVTFTAAAAGVESGGRSTLTFKDVAGIGIHFAMPAVPLVLSGVAKARSTARPAAAADILTVGSLSSEDTLFVYPVRGTDSLLFIGQSRKAVSRAKTGLGFSTLGFTDESTGSSVAVITQSDNLSLSGIGLAARGRLGVGADTLAFTGVGSSNSFPTSASAGAVTFTVAAFATVEKHGSFSVVTLADGAQAVTRLPSGLVVPGGDNSAGLQQVLINASPMLPLSFTESADGLILMANGLDPMIAWDGVAESAWYAGIAAPSTVVWMDGSGNGLLTGARYAFTRFVDADGNFSNLSPVSDRCDLGTDGLIGNVTYSSGGLVTVYSRGHRQKTGQVLTISGVGGIPIVNGTWPIVVVDENNFTLTGLHVTGGAYTSGGVWTFGAAQINYSNVPVSTNPRVVRRQILRNLEGNANVFYVDVDTFDTSGTTFNSSRTDESLATSQSVSLFREDGTPFSQRFYPPPIHKKSLVAYAGRVFATADLTYLTGNVAVTTGSQVVSGIGTAWTAAMAGRLLYVENSSAGQLIESVDASSQVLVLETGFSGASSQIAFYAIRPAPVERRLVYYSEPNLPEAWPPWNAFAVPESSDEIVGIFYLRSFLYILKERHLYKFAFREDPGRDGYVFPVTARGSINQRSYAQIENKYLILDEMGIYAFDGDGIEPVSAAVQSLFKPDGQSLYQLDWTSDRSLWHCVQDPSREVVRWFVDLVGFPSLTYAVCYDYRRQAWWLEQYAEAITASWLAVVGGFRNAVLGTTARRVVVLSQGNLDIIDDAVDGTLRGTVTASDQYTITDANADFPPNLAGVPVSIADGTGALQQAIIIDSTATTLTLLDSLLVPPDSTSVYQVGGINWLWRSGWRRFTEDESENPRDLELVFSPTASQATAHVFTYYDHATKPATEWGYDQAYDGISIVAGVPYFAVDLSTPRGYVIQRRSGRREPYGQGHRYVSVLLSGVQAVDPSRIFQLVVNGAE